MNSFTHDGLTFDVDDAGPQDGPVVLLLHGFPQDRGCWSRVAPGLHAAGLRTLAPDQRGYSPGARPADRAAYRLVHLVGDAVALLDAAGAESAHVVGHDWGGAVAWLLAQHHPDRVASLTAVSTPHPSALQWAIRHSAQWRKSWYMAMFQLPRVPERLIPQALPGLYLGHGMSAQQARPYLDRFCRPGALTGPLNWYRAMAGGSGLSRPPGAVGAPTTFLWGRDDFALGRAAAVRTARYVRGDYAFIEVFEDHWLPEVAPAAVTGAVLRSVHAAG